MSGHLFKTILLFCFIFLIAVLLKMYLTNYVSTIGNKLLEIFAFQYFSKSALL